MKKEIEGAFEAISSSKVIGFAMSKKSDHYRTKVPNELFKSPYKFGQTIILSGKKDQYDNLIDFWLAVQAWYSDGEDTFYENLIFDDITAYKSWYNDIKRIGLCRIATIEEIDRFNKKINKYVERSKPIDYLIMDATWNNQKVIFMDQVNYYLYYFWTGE